MSDIDEPRPLEPPQSFFRDAEAAGIDFEPGDLERLGRFLAMLLEANRSFNLTRITDPEAAWQRHVLDSLSLMPFIVCAEARRVIDVGSGGGLPAVPLAITLPSVSLVALEATGKKARFLERVAAVLELANLEVVDDRAETAAHDRERRERYDVVTARAVGPLRVLLELTVPFARVGGHVLAIKGERAEAEVAEARAALDALHADVVGLNRTATGTIVVVEKRERTPRTYPRRPGEPKRAPL